MSNYTLEQNAIIANWRSLVWTCAKTHEKLVAASCYSEGAWAAYDGLRAEKESAFTEVAKFVPQCCMSGLL